VRKIINGGKMKYLIFTLTFLSFCLFSCQKSTDPLESIIWGEESNGLQISLYCLGQIISQEKLCEIVIKVKNVSEAEISREVYTTLNLIDEGKKQSYISYFNLMAENLNELYESSRSHPKTNLILDSGDQIKFRIDIRELGWVHPVDSRPPYAEFFDFVDKSSYQLFCRLEIVSNGEVISNYEKIEVQ